MRIAVAVWLALMASSATAFSGPEHRYTSNLALRIAIARSDCLDSGIVQELQTLAASSDHSFGAIVEIPDQIKDITPMLDTARHQSPMPRKYSDIDWNHLQSLRGDGLRSLQAKSLNENHFQSLALTTHLVNHDAAIAEARRGRIIRAMLFEAYALHHIEDFLSPGHVATARAGMADFVAIGIHDKYTARGLKFHFDGDQRLVDLARWVANNAAHIDFGPTPAGSTDLHLDGAAFANLATAMEAKSFEHFLGDSNLHRKRLSVQAAYVTAIAALSLAEVLCEDAETNAFANFCWKWGGDTPPCAHTPPASETMLRAAQIVGGGYEDQLGPFQVFIPGEVVFLTLENGANPDRRGSDFEKFVGTRALSLETLIVAVPPTTRELPPVAPRFLSAIFREFTPALLIGYSRGVGPGEGTRSVGLRTVVPIRRTNLQLSLIQGTEFSGSRRSNVTGTALEAGFGFLFVRFGGEQHVSTTPLGSPSKKILYTFGVTGIIPGRTVLHAIRE